eukprot:gnl/MRDRNA2_/MRDRNA2_314564_c0_seq1.p1 gnl/MRDRNA2_/MRDRNA2_314564_c0~~gnl/MRDRNA2_/MRDRNA2_314564_c0_seq1.p1  ORF type:complete len:145 (-),score=22.70 gnl/MRDRNA2_/MRDRNA2_314564_c0_seq1:214-597(-)
MAAQNKNPEYIKDIWRLFNIMDMNGDGQIDLHELYTMLNDEETCNKLVKLGVVPHELPGLFTLMDDGDNEFSFCEFLTGIMRMKNAHKGVDLTTILYENKKILKRVLAGFADTQADIGKLRQDLASS